VIQAVKNSASGLLGSSVVVVPTWATDNGRDSEVSVQATFTYRALVPLVPLPAITIQAESTLVINN
jgi:hypothetical protein